MTRRSVPFALALPLALAALPGCTGTRGASPRSEAGTAAVATFDGAVRLPAASLPFVRVAPVEGAGGTVEIRIPARVAFKDAAVSRLVAPVAGRVTAVVVKTGDRVSAGQPLLTIASPDAASARTAVSSARAALREAETDADRQARMTREGVGVERERTEAEARLAEARSEVDRAEATAALLGPGSGADVVVRSPIAGTVIDLEATVGGAAEPGGDPLVQVGDPDAVWIVADVTGRDLPLIAEGSPATVELSGVPDPLDARVVSIGSVLSDSLRTAPVRLELGRGAPGLRPGTFGRVTIRTAARGATLPATAVVIQGGTDPVVWVARGTDTFVRRSVVVGRPVGGRVQVLSGLTPGDRVVVEGALLLDGSAEQLL